MELAPQLAGIQILVHQKDARHAGVHVLETLPRFSVVRGKATAGERMGQSPYSLFIVQWWSKMWTFVLSECSGCIFSSMVPVPPQFHGTPEGKRPVFGPPYLGTVALHPRLKDLVVRRNGLLCQRRVGEHQEVSEVASLAAPIRSSVEASWQKEEKSPQCVQSECLERNTCQMALASPCFILTES